MSKTKANSNLNLIILFLLVIIALLVIYSGRFNVLSKKTEVNQLQTLVEDSIDQSSFSFRENIDSIFFDFHFVDVHQITLITYWGDSTVTLVKGSSSDFAVDKFLHYEIKIERFEDCALRFRRTETLGSISLQEVETRSINCACNAHYNKQAQLFTNDTYADAKLRAENSADCLHLFQSFLLL